MTADHLGWPKETTVTKTATAARRQRATAAVEAKEKRVGFHPRVFSSSAALRGGDIRRVAPLRLAGGAYRRDLHVVDRAAG